MSPRQSVAEMTIVQRCVESIRHMILIGDLLPGETLRQESLAERLGASRVPIREALISLQAEGVVTYVPRSGYTVARFNLDELREVYLMRTLLEHELLIRVDLDRVDTAQLDRLNDALELLDDGEMLWEHKQLNRDFHFGLFEMAAMPTVLAEVSRLWNMTELYRSLYAYERDSRRRIVAEHRRIIAAVRAKDPDRLLAEANAHRDGALDAISRRLRPAVRTAGGGDPVDRTTTVRP